MQNKSKKRHATVRGLGRVGKLCLMVCILGLMSPMTSGPKPHPDNGASGSAFGMRPITQTISLDFSHPKGLSLQASLISGLSSVADWLASSSSKKAGKTSKPATVRQLETAIREGRTDEALALLRNTDFARSITATEYDRLRLRLAKAMLPDHDTARLSWALARMAQRRSAGQVPEADWIAGLSAWQAGEFKDAQAAFTAAAQASEDEWVRAAASFWAARAAAAQGHMKNRNALLQAAAAYPKTFYGLLALEALGQEPAFNWDLPAYAKTHEALLSKTPAGKEALEHLRNGRLSAADRALQRLGAEERRDLRLAALGLATRAGLPASALRLAKQVEKQTGIRYDAAYYPVGGWLETEEYEIDPALVHAIIRQESAFNPRAQSGKGARGLMQLMPATARYVADKGRAVDLGHSLDNLELGQRYLRRLMADKAVEGDLIRGVIAYNAGPGNLARWQKRMPDVAQNDPLLFMELIPAGETRVYVEKVMAGYWIYRDRLGLENPVLASLVSNTLR